MFISVQSITRKLKTHSLFIAILLGFIGYLAFKYIPAFNYLRPVAKFSCDCLPFFLFLILFLSFLKIDIKEMIPKKWQLYLACTQLFLSAFLVFVVCYYPLDKLTLILLEGAIVCAITPTAASASVITGKLGGNESALTTFTIISNIVAACSIPVLFPLLTDTIDSSFIDEFILILNKVFSVLVVPLVLACIIKTYFKKLHAWIMAMTKDLGFYLWLATLVIQSGRIFKSVDNSNDTVWVLISLFGVGLLCTIVQFILGKFWGHFENQRITAGQALGQKNTIFGIWIAILYLSPTVAIVPGSYLLWQNLVNAYQMYYREKTEAKRAAMGLSPYQE